MARDNKFVQKLKKNILFEKEDVELSFINWAFFLRRYDIPDDKIFDMLTQLYNKARNDILR